MDMTMKKINPWEERFGWYHYSGEIIFADNDDQLWQDALRYQEQGVTTVILFSTHFRFSFWAYWDRIEKTIGRVVKVFHSLGIKVVEHHSSHLTHNPVDEKVWEHLLRTDRRNTYGLFPNFRETSQANPVLGGAHLNDFAQIDGSTGKMALSSYIHTEKRDMTWIYKHYNGNAHCFNHPAYEEAYKGHLKRIIEQGVDGMMNDDVQWYGGSNGCACEYCRAKFKEASGYDLPTPDEWDTFIENYDDPRYIAWRKWKKQSSSDFHFRMDAFYQSLGFDPLRPAYCAEVLPFDSTAYGFEGAAELWDFIFQECCGVIKSSFICFAGEAVHRYALAKRHGVPSMAMMYPWDRSGFYAGWALSRSWGQLFTGANSSLPAPLDGDLRLFEAKHRAFYDAPDKVSDVAFYFSKKTRDLCDENAPRKYMRPLMSYIESAYVSGIGCDMVFEEDTLEELCKRRVIAMVSICALEDQELEKLRAYVEQGGTLFISGVFAQKDDEFKKRSINTALQKLGMQSHIAARKASWEPVSVQYEGKTLHLPKAQVYGVFDRVNGEAFAMARSGVCVGVKEQVGKGQVLMLCGETGENPIQPAIWPTGNPEGSFTDRSFEQDMKAENGALLRMLLGTRVTVEGAKCLIPTLYRVEQGYALHIVNARDMLPEEDSFVPDQTVIPQFDDTDKERLLLPGLTVRVTDVPLGDVKKVVFVTPEQAEVEELAAEQTAEGFIIRIPENRFSGYGLIEIYC